MLRERAHAGPERLPEGVRDIEGRRETHHALGAEAQVGMDAFLVEPVEPQNTAQLAHELLNGRRKQAGARGDRLELEREEHSRPAHGFEEVGILLLKRFQPRQAIDPAHAGLLTEVLGHQKLQRLQPNRRRQ